TLRDLQFRRRQFAIAVVGTAFAFALALVLTGMSAGFRHEARNTVDAIGAGAWVVPKGVKGPFTSESTMPAALTRQIMGGGQAEPMVDFGGVVKLPAGDEVNVNVIGHSIGALGDPIWGRPGTPVPSGETVVDERLGADQGDTITVASRRLRVVREISDRTYFAGQPTIFVSLAEGQAIAFGGKPLATAFVTRGVPTQIPPGFQVVSNNSVREDLLRPLDGAVGSIDITRLLTWLLAVVVIGAVTYLSALERLRDFAVLKAVGGSTRRVMLSLAAQAVLASLLAAVLGALVAQVLAPNFPLPVVIEPAAYVLLGVIAVLVGVLASLAAMRRAIKVDPALAFSGG
ncbi:MAG TPA: ABC transporter permease, partial [Solirubrobacterales bacterium]|nr:ABC transporter permease [Solirubrobacterales bacterium]